MCRDELILKQTAVGLVALDSPAEDASALLSCFEGTVGRLGQVGRAVWVE